MKPMELWDKDLILSCEITLSVHVINEHVPSNAYLLIGRFRIKTLNGLGENDLWFVRIRVIFGLPVLICDISGVIHTMFQNGIYQFEFAVPFIHQKRIHGYFSLSKGEPKTRFWCQLPTGILVQKIIIVYLHILELSIISIYIVRKTTGLLHLTRNFFSIEV